MRLEAVVAAVAPFRDAALDRWHRKAVLAAGGGAQHGSLRALDQAISTQARMLFYLQHCNAAAGQSAQVESGFCMIPLTVRCADLRNLTQPFLHSHSGMLSRLRPCGVMTSTGHASMRQNLQGKIRVLHGPQVAALMRDPVRSRLRSQLPSAQAPRPMCRPVDFVRPCLMCQFNVFRTFIGHACCLCAHGLVPEALCYARPIQ